MDGRQWSMEGEGQSQGEKEETGGSQEEKQGAEGRAIPAEEQGEAHGGLRGGVGLRRRHMWQLALAWFDEDGARYEGI